MAAVATAGSNCTAKIAAVGIGVLEARFGWLGGAAGDSERGEAR